MRTYLFTFCCHCRSPCATSSYYWLVLHVLQQYPGLAACRLPHSRSRRTIITAWNKGGRRRWVNMFGGRETELTVASISGASACTCRCCDLLHFDAAWQHRNKRLGRLQHLQPMQCETYAHLTRILLSSPLSFNAPFTLMQFKPRLLLFCKYYFVGGRLRLSCGRLTFWLRSIRFLHSLCSMFAVSCDSLLL